MSAFRWVGLLLVAGLFAGCGEDPGSTGLPTASAEAGWTRLPDPPLGGRTGAVVAAAAGEVLVVGGWEFLCPPGADCTTPEGPLLTDGAALDPGTGEWRPIADPPYGVRDAETAATGTDLYLLTGCRTGPSCDGPLELLRYDTVRDRWTTLAPVPAEVRHADLVAVPGGLVALATTDEHGERRDQRYDPVTDRWRQLPDDPLAAAYDRHAVVDGDRLLVFGSTLDADGERDAKIGAALDLRTLTWTRLPDAPGSGYQVWRVGDEAWLNPHYGDGGGVLDLATDTWRPFPDDPAGPGWQHDLAGVIGEDEGVYAYDAGWVRDTRAHAWLHVPERPGDVYDESLTAVGDALVVFGGQRFAGPDGELLPETWVWRPPA